VWPALPLTGWVDTKETLHLWAQIVGKVRLALAAPVNHWWHVPLYVDARGLTTSAMPFRGGTVEMRFDFIDHQLFIETSDGARESVELEPRSVADFHDATMRALRHAGVHLHIFPRAVERVDIVLLDRDEAHGSYDADAARTFHRELTSVAHALTRFRGEFIGKCSPVHFWWGSFDISCTRFSGRPAPPHPGGVPNCPDYVTREAYSHECISAGWWPGGGLVDDAAFYAYAYPEPPGCATAAIRPVAATYHPGLREWILPYESVRHSETPDRDVIDFFRTTYAAGADLAEWDRHALERSRTDSRSSSPWTDRLAR
jgi:hypothetical protein